MTMRPKHAMSEDIANALRAAAVLTDYEARPAYQKNDYVGWIGRAKTETTRRKRIDQMLDELRSGGVYMGMEHAPSRKS